MHENNNLNKFKITAKKRTEKYILEGNIKPDYNVTAKVDVKYDAQEWLKNNFFENAYAITLTMKKFCYRKNYDGSRTITQKNDYIVASYELMQFLNQLNRRIFGMRSSSGYRSNWKRLKCIPFFEGSPDGEERIHFHLILEKPQQISEQDFITKIAYYWSKRDFARDEMKILKIDNYDGWVSYCMKKQLHEFGGFNLDTPNIWLT